ncbi:hypothetical protein Ae201684P_020607 [Aphanomyces euteiches]|nr:hypothetical protein Ae201684P_020607 [Aphanomyces euteiches]
MDTMIDNASSHFQAAQDSKHASASNASQNALGDNFPLLPLDSIPSLETFQLQQCRQELVELLKTLTDDPEDVCLGQYIKKQLAIMTAEMEDRRAKQRIAALISGNTAAIVEVCHPFNSATSKMAPSPFAKPLTSAVVQPTEAMASKAETPKLSLREMKSRAKFVKFKSHEESAKFVILGNPKKGVKRKKKKTKPPPDPEEILRKQREERRRLAHARLLARQAKIAQKKQLALEKSKMEKKATAKDNQDSSSTDDDGALDKASSSSDEYVDDPNPLPQDVQIQGEKMAEPISSGLTPESNHKEEDERISRINSELCKVQADENLAEIRKSPSSSANLPIFEAVSPRAAEKSEASRATMEIPALNNQTDSTLADISHEIIANKSSCNSPANKLSHDDSESTFQKVEKAQELIVADNISVEEKDPQEDDSGDSDDDEIHDGEQAQYDISTFHTYSKGQANASPQSNSTIAESSVEKSPRQSPKPVPPWFEEPKQVATHQEIHDTVLGACVEIHGDIQCKSDSNPISSGAEIARRILSNLARDKTNIETCQHGIDSAISSLAATPRIVVKANPLPVDSSTKKLPRPSSAKKIISRRGNNIEPRPKKENTSQNTITNQEKIDEGMKKLNLKLLRSPSKDIKDYTPIFRNFYCIMTSFYERMKDAPSVPANSKDILQNGDSALRFQLKLYTVWTNIMHDYATVFGVEGLLKTQREISSSCVYDGKSTPYTAQYRINSHTRREVFGIVAEALQKIPDWEELPVDLGLNTSWNLLWTWSKPRVDRQTLLAWQKVNHFAGAKALTRKDMLKKSLHRYVSMGEKMKGFDIAPETFILPNDYIPFVQSFKRRADSIGSSKNFWIMKPVALSRGRGISLLNDLGQVAYGEAVIVQKYIENPLLLDGYKFDLRLYVLVTSFNPLEAFFYNEGFVRICSHRYSTDSSDMGDLFMHLTNSSLQKHSNMEDEKENPVNNASSTEAGGTKASLAYLWSRLHAQNAPVEEIKAAILDVIVKSLVAGEDSIPYQVNSFDLYGYDILLDVNYRPWLIEINSSPSLARENHLDHVVKDALLYDTIQLVKPMHFDRAALVSILKRRADENTQDKKRPSMLHPLEAEERAKKQLNEDLTDILRGELPRQYGELPESMGNFQRIAPGPIHSQAMKLKRSCFREKK